jgi:transcriptional regulator with XRE-family HTH domain
MRSRSLPASASHPLGDLLRHWRARRGLSQLELSADIGVSQRHLSFIESGRSDPSRALVLGLTQALDVPLRDRNALLLAAGYAPMYPDPAWNAAEMRAVNRALERMLRQHEPFPAVVMDRHWNVLATNAAAPRFFGSFIDLAARAQPRNLLHLVFDPHGMRPFIANWPQVARGLFERIAREAVGGVIDKKMQALIAELKGYPDIDVGWEGAEVLAAGPVIPISFVKDGRPRSYFSMVSTVGTPRTIAAQELRVECMFAADDATQAWHLEMFPMPA